MTNRRNGHFDSYLFGLQELSIERGQSLRPPLVGANLRHNHMSEVYSVVNLLDETAAARVSRGMTWGVVALNSELVPFAVSARESIAP